MGAGTVLEHSTDLACIGDPRGGVLAPRGFRAAGVATGVKTSKGLDLGLLVADDVCATVGVFTRSALPAAPVRLCRERLGARPAARAIVINAGNANALTGARGIRDAERMVDRVEARCGGPALVLSTGIIGVPLPVEKVLRGVDAAAEHLSPDGGSDLARAMLTTDTRAKQAAVHLPPNGAGERFSVGGVAKGSGMIHPNMATMLAVMTTDAAVEAPALESLLRDAVDRSFHRISVDGDTSTNDSVLLMASGQASSAPIRSTQDPRYGDLAQAITRVAESLARQIIDDGEGSTRIMKLTVTGAQDGDQARAIADAIMRSPLVKTALYGGDPNWGRILCAAGNSGEELEPSEIVLSLGGVVVFEAGEPCKVDGGALRAACSAPEVDATLRVGAGPCTRGYLVSDLGHGYIDINAGYRT